MLIMSKLDAQHEYNRAT